MKYLAAYLLLVEGGNAKPSVRDIKHVVESIGVEAEESRIESLLSSLEGKTSLNELIAEGQQKLASVPAGGVASAGAGGSAGAAGGEEAEEAEEEAKEESDDDMGFGLFD
ncbi:ZYBA0S05-05380g1_1 [Zygosaccharomyces bailii CLIB 213]|uniref:ZYBA0S05-05380g1_1 n=1 Tax=Zygosaccharomyces bailii (strain CLIB 213 / ATCC 58445 / CBS 680 / BCRC 21525 / NBRC 1098 / NCYC 1416 / NRRL Y-2227) TaxID=1333698 RepID=A0A8J2X0W9_ZYGB2|nr:ZYBA0S05-05380g1_1 [Zygosaccharomyces bailii CLIB 213]